MSVDIVEVIKDRVKNHEYQRLHTYQIELDIGALIRRIEEYESVIGGYQEMSLRTMKEVEKLQGEVKKLSESAKSLHELS